jgi:DNA invertase Pin-like site-specific DNA recombinase
MDKIAAYTRVSTTEQSTGYGRDTQETKIQQWADLNDVDNVDWFDDTASGGDTDRPGLQDMIQRLRECEYDALVVYKADRLSRSLKDLLTVIDDVLEPCDTAFISVTEQFDTSTPSGRLFLQMIGSFSEFERALITERLQEGRRSKAETGGHAAGEVPFGYEKNGDGELVLSDHAETVKRIFQMRDDGETLRSIADTLNEDGVPTKKGGEWHASTVSYILKNDKYKGLMRHEIGGETVERERPDLAVNGESQAS